MNYLKKSMEYAFKRLAKIQSESSLNIIRTIFVNIYTVTLRWQKKALKNGLISQ